MSSRKPLATLLKEWDDWSSTADKTTDGWEASFPRWMELMAAAQAMLKEPVFSPRELQLLERCWLLSEEAEDLATFAEDHIDEFKEALLLLAGSAYPTVRWQVYSTLGNGGEFSEAVLRAGLEDEDNYCRRRAILALARHMPHDALDLARRFSGDDDPYIRQASIELLSVATPDPGAVAMLEAFLDDPVDHVRRAAQKKLDVSVPGFGKLES